MSLVAAYSGSSEDEDESQFTKKTDHLSVAENAKKKLDNNGEVEHFDILDDEEWLQTPQINPVSIFSNLPSRKEATSFEETEEKDDEFLKIKPIFSDDVKHNLVDTFDKQENMKAFMNLPRPVKGGKKGTVKISLPSYTSGNDSEDEVGGDVGDIGKIQETNLQLRKKSSLFTILPKPKNSVSVGANKNKVFQKQTNRSLVPHTLKKAPTSDKPKQNIMINTIDKVQDELSEDEDDVLDNSSNFFSLGKEDISTNNESDHFAVAVSADIKSSNSKKMDMFPSNHSQPPLIIPHSPNPKDSFAVSSVNPVTTNSDVSLKQTTFFSNLYFKDLNKSANSNVCKDEKKIDYNKKEFSPHPETTYSDVTAPYGGVASNNPNEKFNENQLVEKKSESFFAYGYQSTHEDPENVSTAEPTDFYNQSNVDMPLDQDAIKALVGGKRKFRKEEINIIDVKGEDLQISKGEYLKNLTQESGYKPKISKKDEPRKLEKRKHQITYLAYQAKEREHELRQAWSISRATRRDTQSKYGF